MRVFVSIDLEGCTGVCDLTQTRANGAGYPAALALARGDLECGPRGLPAGRRHVDRRP